MVQIKRVNLMLSTNNYLARFLNIIRLIEFYLFNLNTNKRNSALKVNKGKRCFIIGNGPSLKNIDLTLLKSEDTFTVNDFYDYCNVDFESKYHLFIDPIYKNSEGIVNVYNKTKKTIIILSNNCFDKRKKTNFCKERLYIINTGLVQHDNFVSCDMNKIMTGSINVINVAIECAIYMGYDNIYLLGCDFNNYAVQKEAHFYEEDAKIINIENDNLITYLLAAALCHMHHFALSYESKRNNQRIINLTSGSLIAAYPRDSINNIINGK